MHFFNQQLVAIHPPDIMPGNHWQSIGKPEILGWLILHLQTTNFAKSLPGPSSLVTSTIMKLPSTPLALL
jgi:hypothetical protein